MAAESEKAAKKISKKGEMRFFDKIVDEYLNFN